MMKRSIQKQKKIDKQTNIRNRAVEQGMEDKVNPNRDIPEKSEKLVTLKDNVRNKRQQAWDRR